jgi:hypothetical protein
MLTLCAQTSAMSNVRALSYMHFQKRDALTSRNFRPKDVKGSYPAGSLVSDIQFNKVIKDTV